MYRDSGGHREDESSVDFRLVASREKKVNQTEQSNLPHSVTFWYSLHLIGQFGFLFPRWDKQPEINCNHNNRNTVTS